MRIISLSATHQEIDEMISFLRQGAVIIYPTDTVYGIGCDATNRDAIERIYKIKKRPTDNPMSVAFSDFNMLQEYTELDEEQMTQMKNKLPGPYTFIVRAQNLPEIITKDNKVGVRIPEIPTILYIISKFGKPIVTTSANIAKQRPTHLFDKIDQNVLRGVDFAIKEDIGSGLPSAVIDLTTGKALR